MCTCGITSRSCIYRSIACFTSIQLKNLTFLFRLAFIYDMSITSYSSSCVLHVHVCFFSFTRWNCCLSTWLKVLRSVFTDLNEGSLSLYWTPNMYKTYHAIRRIVPLDWWFISNDKKIPHHKRQCCSQINILIINTLTTHIVATKRIKSLPRLPLLI